MDPSVVTGILRHLRLPTVPPLAPARGGGSAPLPLLLDDPAAEVPEHAEICHVPAEGFPIVGRRSLRSDRRRRDHGRCMATCDGQARARIAATPRRADSVREQVESRSQAS